MLTDETLQQLQRYNFDLLARQELNGQRRMRYIALAHLKDGKNFTEVADALRVTRHSVMRWLKWFDFYCRLWTRVTENKEQFRCALAYPEVGEPPLVRHMQKGWPFTKQFNRRVRF
jgi:hypothetical protein